MGERMTKEEEAWRVQYLANRYLEHEPIVMLQARAMDITLSACEIDHLANLPLREQAGGGRKCWPMSSRFQVSKHCASGAVPASVCADGPRH